MTLTWEMIDIASPWIIVFLVILLVTLKLARKGDREEWDD